VVDGVVGVDVIAGKGISSVLIEFRGCKRL